MLTEDDKELLGVYEIAEMAAVSTAAVANWRARFKDFPSPVAELRSGPVFRLSHVRRWLRKRRGRMATVISTINLKGGVGKSTTTVAVAEILSTEMGKRVLVIDLDPQTNATVMLIGERTWKKQNDAGHTLAQLFKDALLDDPTKRKFDLDQTLLKGVSNVREVRSVDLLPSSIDLIEVQDRLVLMPAGPFHTGNPTDILRRAINKILDRYDFVLIDCPPNLGIITLNGLRISHSYIIPTIPDVLSTYGIPQIIRRVKQFSDEIGESIDPLGIAICKYEQRSRVHRRILHGLRSGTIKVSEAEAIKVFNQTIPQRTELSDSAEYTPLNTLRQKYGYQGEYTSYLALAREIAEAAEGVTA